MDKKQDIKFLKKIFLAITDFRIYPYLIKHEKLIKSFVYLLGIVLILSFVISLNVFAELNKTVVELIQDYDKIVPDFEFENGKLEVSEVIYRELNNNSYIIVDTNHTYDEIKTNKEYEKALIYDFCVVIDNENIIIESSGVAQRSLELKNIEYGLNKEGLFNALNKYNEDMAYKLLIYIEVYFAIFIVYFIIVLSKVIFISFIISFISLLFGIFLNYSSYLKIAIYIHTLPLILEVIAICLVGTIKDYAYYTSLILTYVYAIYSIRAIKLDAFLIMFSSKKNKKHTASKFENELKKYDEIMENNTHDDSTSDKTKKDDDNEEKK